MRSDEVREAMGKESLYIHIYGENFTFFFE